MYEELKPLYPEGPTNRTDPIVRHDSKYNSEMIATLWRPQYDEENGGVAGSNIEATKWDAIRYPLIRINNHILTEDCIRSFKLHNDRFMPYLDIVFEDLDDTIQFSDMPGLDNVVTVVMLESDPLAHRPIKMDFYVTDCKIIGNTFYVWAEFKCLPLEQQLLQQEVFHYPDEGCQAEHCKLPANMSPTTYEFLHVIAEKAGLGFSASQKCRSIKDDRYRILKKEKYKYAAQEHTACGGLDENSIFDSWIDPWANLVMVNLPWIMNEKVLPDELSSTIITGVHSGDATVDTLSTTTDVHRILSNISTVTGFNNMMITKIEKLVDLNSGYYKGTMTEYTTVMPEGYKDSSNELKQEQIMEREDSLAAQSTPEKFEFHSQEFCGFEMSMKTPTVQQRHRHDEYFKQQRAHMFKVTMLEPNFGLERGMLCNLLWFTDNTMQKSIILDRTPNLYSNDGDTTRKNNPEDSSLDDIYKPVLDVALSGMYYIDGTDWEYSADDENITQHLYLIKKSSITQYYDKTGLTRFAR